MSKNIFLLFLVTLPVVILITLSMDSQIEISNTNAATLSTGKNSSTTAQTVTSKTTNLDQLWQSLGIEKIGPASPPEFTIENINGNMEGLEKYKGKVVFLNFWATWCPPCVQEMPMMDRLYKSLKDKGFVVVALNDYEPRERVEKFLKDKSYSFPVLIDPSGKVSEAFRSMVLPSTFIIDREGNVIGKVVGMREWDAPEYQAFFEQLLK